MKRTLLFIGLFCALLKPTDMISGLSLTMQLTYECDSIGKFGNLSVTEFTVEPSENTTTISSSDVILFGAALAAKNIALQTTVMTKKYPEKIALLTEQIQQNVDKLLISELRNKQTELKLKQEKIKQKKLLAALDENITSARNELLQIFKKNNEDFKDNDDI